MRFWIVQKQTTADAIINAVHAGVCQTETDVETLVAQYGDKVSWASEGICSDDMGSKELNQNKLLLNVAEAAKLLGLSRPKVYELTRSDHFPAFKVGGRTVISAEGLREWVRTQVSEGARF